MRPRFYALKRFIHLHRQVSSCNNKLEWVKPSGNETVVTVYNSITRSKKPLILKNNNVVTWYMCGPTVYDSAHIGHACTYVSFDIIRRILSEFFNINIISVMGITDIDDKIIKRSNESGKPWQELTQHYEKEFFSDMDSLNVLRPFIACRVSNYIPEIIAFVQKIVDKNCAYKGQDGSIYFDTTSCETYGKFKTLQTSEPNPNKKSPQDFALWKASKENEPYWKSPWGHGRPGWHIECSAIASTILGNTIDIHSGGLDLMFPHHENEEAQSCCYHDKNQWVNYWMHTGHLNLTNDIKMSKSLKNTTSIPSLLNKYTANHFRMICLLRDYKKNIIFSDELIKKANSILNKINFFIDDCNAYVSGKYFGANIQSSELLDCLAQTRTNVTAAFADDFNTPKAIGDILQLISVGNRMIRQEQTATVGRCPESVAAVSNYVQFIVSKLGVSPAVTSNASNDISNVLNTLIEFRHNVRIRALDKQIKDAELLKFCDEVRKKLYNDGVDIRDHPQKSSWTLRQK